MTRQPSQTHPRANPRVVLASASPRRKELLSRLLPRFEVQASDSDESLLPEERLESATRRLAAAKAGAISASNPDALVVAADTLVGLRGPKADLILSKPTDAQAARQMLKRLSGRTHLVVTGVALIMPESAGQAARIFGDRTEVAFRRLTDQEIADYVATGEPMDKAGAYGIQGGAAGFVESIAGSLTNVIGLPLEMLASELTSLGLTLLS